MAFFFKRKPKPESEADTELGQALTLIAPPELSAVAPTGEEQLGTLLIDAGILTPKDVERIVEAQQRTGQRFGEVALSLQMVTQADIDAALSRQFDFPQMPAMQRPFSSKVVSAYNPLSRVGEAMRALRSQLTMRWIDGSPQRRMLAVAGSERGEGRSFIASNLAVTFAQTGARTILIDANLRDPVQHKLFRLRNKQGLTGILSGRAGAEEITRLRVLPALSVLPAGPAAPNPQELLTRPAFGKVLDRIAQRFDVVLIDTPAATESSDAQVIAQRAGGTVLVARKDTSSLDRLKEFEANLSQLGSRIVGLVYNEF